jgi:lysophosphatidate acyltransferase
MFALAIVASCVNGIVGALILYPLGKGIWVNQMIAYTMKLLVPLLTGMHFDIVSGDEHLESTKPRIYLCNHQATLDMFLFGACLPKRCVITAKREVKFIPFMGQAFVMGKNILLNRQNRESAIEALNKVGEQMIKDNLSLWVFPEGTRTHQIDNSIRPLKKGAFHLAKQYGFELVPIVASTFYPVYNEKRMIFERGTIQIKGNL